MNTDCVRKNRNGVEREYKRIGNKPCQPGLCLSRCSRELVPPYLDADNPDLKACATSLGARGGIKALAYCGISREAAIKKLQRNFRALKNKTHKKKDPKPDDAKPVDPNIRLLVEMGYPEDLARNALEAAGGNPELAINFLVDAEVPEPPPKEPKADPKADLKADPKQKKIKKTAKRKTLLKKGKPVDLSTCSSKLSLVTSIDFDEKEREEIEEPYKGPNYQALIAKARGDRDMKEVMRLMREQAKANAERAQKPKRIVEKDLSYEHSFEKPDGSKVEITVNFKPDKVIKLASQKCYLIDELAAWIYSNKKNLDPEGKPLWNDKEELLQIRDYPTMHPKAKPLLRQTIDKLVKELYSEKGPAYLESMEKHPEVWHQIGITGYLCLSDYTSEAAYGPQHGNFLTAEPGMFNLSQIFDAIPKKYSDAYRRIKNNAGHTIPHYLEGSGKGCVHGLGMQLLHFYFQMYRAVLEHYQEDPEKLTYWKDLAMGGIYDTTITVDRRSHKVFFFLHETYDSISLDRNGSIVDVNNMVRRKDKSGNYKNRYASPTLMMYAPNLCNLPGKMVRLGRVNLDFVSSDGHIRTAKRMDKSDMYLGLHHPRDYLMDPRVSNTWCQFLNRLMDIIQKIHNQLRQWKRDDRMKYLTRFYLSVFAKLSCRDILYSSFLATSIVDRIALLESYLENRSYPELGLTESEIALQESLNDEFVELKEMLENMKKAHKTSFPTRESLGSRGIPGYPFSFLELKKEGHGQFVRNYVQKELYGLENYSSDADKIMENILTSDSRQEAMLRDLTNFETHPNHFFYQIERVMVFNILRNIGETTPSMNLLKDPPTPPKYMLKQTLKKDEKKPRKTPVKKPKKIIKNPPKPASKKTKKKSPSPPAVDYNKLIGEAMKRGDRPEIMRLMKERAAQAAKKTQSRSSSTDEELTPEQIKLHEDCGGEFEPGSRMKYTEMTPKQIENLVRIRSGDHYNCYLPETLYNHWRQQTLTNNPFTDPATRASIGLRIQKEILRKHKALGAPKSEWVAPGTGKTRKFDKKNVTLTFTPVNPVWNFESVFGFSPAEIRRGKIIRENIIRKVKKRLEDFGVSPSDPIFKSIDRYGLNLDSYSGFGYSQLDFNNLFKYRPLTVSEDGKTRRIQDSDHFQYPVTFYRVEIEISRPRKHILVGYIPADIEEMDTGNSYDTTGSIIAAIQALFDRDDRALLTRHNPNRRIACCTVDLPKNIGDWYDWDEGLDNPQIEQWGLINYRLLGRVSERIRRAADIADYELEPED